MCDIQQDFLYVYSCDVDLPVQIKIGSLEGTFERPSYEALLKDSSQQYCVALQYDNKYSDLKAELRVFCYGRQVGLPVFTSYKHFTSRYNWNEWLTLPICYSELSRDAQIAITVFDLHDSTKLHAIGGTSMALFSKRGVYRQGIYDMKMWPFEHGDGINRPSKTPGKLPKSSGSQMARLSKLTKKHRSGMMSKVDWLDRLTFREIELINENEKRNSNSLFLMVEFSRIELKGQRYALVYYEPNGNDVVTWNPAPSIVTCPDPEIGLENLVELKHHQLARGERGHSADKDLKPNAVTRDQLNHIIAYSPTAQLTTEEKDLVWKFRFYLVSNKKALPKFLKCVDWDLSHEVKQASELLKLWEPMDVEDALELLSPEFSHPVVRRYAVERLHSDSNQDLPLYLLQLVQALKYENLNEIRKAEKLISSPASPEIMLSSQEPPLLSGTTTVSTRASQAEFAVRNDGKDLASFLVDAAVADPVIANYLFWYLRVECITEDINYMQSAQRAGKGRSEVHEMYLTIAKRLSKALATGNDQALRCRSQLRDQQEFVKRLTQIMNTVAKESGNRAKKVNVLQAQLNIEQAGSVNFSDLGGLPLPLDPQVKVKRVIAEKAHLFNSALMPAKLTFLTNEDKEYVTIFKHGDDLRQDQLILQVITLFDRLLRIEQLDLRLTPYRVLATAPDHGFVQYIDSQPLRDVIAQWDSSIQNFLRHYHPDSSCAYGIEAEVMENYVRSCAGYSVICYLLGVGDRHLHNLLLTKDGHVFHVDFGFILGRDPKPLPPPMKLTREMIDGLGGLSSQQWAEFRRLCYTAFLHLRRHANLILNLFALMVDASIPDIAAEPDKTVRKVQERFRLDLGEEEAVNFVQQLIDVSVSAKMAAISDFVHDVAQYWRK